MNYAEDRLDRRARTSVETADSATTAKTSSWSNNDSTSLSTAQELDRDLISAHSVFRRYRSTYTLIDVKSDDSSAVEALRELTAAHELAGKTLRDMGSNRQAVFHFGMAWKCCHHLNRNFLSYRDSWNCTFDVLEVRCGVSDDENCNDIADREWKSVGDYAQMAELAGFPEVGVMALFFYRAGGTLDCASLNCPYVSSACRQDDLSDKQECGCGMAECGASPCFIAFPPSSNIVESILRAFDELAATPEAHCDIKTVPTALDILNQLSLLSGKSSNHTRKERVLVISKFMNERLDFVNHMPAILQFWEVGNQSSNAIRSMHSVLLLLLLKLLYSSPVSGPFIRLSCLSIPYLSVILPISSPEGRFLAKHFKSHWAYYVFIRSLVLGERVKTKRHPGQSPLWDLVFGGRSQHGSKSPSCKVWNEVIPFSTHMQELITHLSIHRETSGLKYLPSILTCGLPYSPLYFLGDSHTLSLAWQSLCITSSDGPVYRTAVPFPSTGIKAWHFRKCTKFFTYFNLHACLRRLIQYRSIHRQSRIQTIIVSAGEIDCREGIGGSMLQGYYKDCTDAVKRTLFDYLSSLSDVAKEYSLQILIMPVAPHAQRSEKNGKAVGRAKRRETMHLWNEILKDQLCRRSDAKYENLYLLDYEEKLRYGDPRSPVGYVLHPSFNADYTHVNSSIIPLLEKSLHKSGCNMDLI